MCFGQLCAHHQEKQLCLCDTKLVVISQAITVRNHIKGLSHRQELGFLVEKNTKTNFNH